MLLPARRGTAAAVFLVKYPPVQRGCDGLARGVEARLAGERFGKSALYVRIPAADARRFAAGSGSFVAGDRHESGGTLMNHRRRSSRFESPLLTTPLLT